MRVLFVSRAFPPTVGGIEQQNADLARFLGRECELTLIANRRGKGFLPFFFPYALFRTLFLLPRHDVLLLGDGVLAILGAIIKLFFPKKTVVTILHGLDLTYASTLYQSLWVKHFLPRHDGAIAVSRATESVAVEKGFDHSKIFVIPNGLESAAFRFPEDRAQLSARVGFDTSERILLLTLGRLVKRKGVAWFIRSVLPSLPQTFHYIVAGTGPEEAAIRNAIGEAKLEDRVSLLGYITPADRALFLGNVDIFVQPNIPVAGDMEGFGIAAIEASAAGLPVVASDLEGLRDAVTHEGNGLLVPTQNATAFIHALTTLSDPTIRKAWRARAATFATEHFDWDVIARRYLSLLEDFVGSTKDAH